MTGKAPIIFQGFPGFPGAVETLTTINTGSAIYNSLMYMWQNIQLAQFCINLPVKHRTLE